MKKIVLIFAVLILIVAGCAKKDINPLSPETTLLTTDENPLHLEGVSGTLVTDPTSVGVHPDDEASWIYIHFDDVVNTTSTGIKVEEADGGEVAYTYEWSTSGGQSDLLMKPVADLDYNTTYILKLYAGDVYDIRGNFLDSDMDDIGGESPDDDYILLFATVRSNGLPGDSPFNLEDIYHPWISGPMYFLIGDSVVYDVWTDVDVAINIVDLTIDASDSSLHIVGVDPNTINGTTMMLILANSGEKVSLDGVTYEDDTSETNFGRVTVKPEENLEPGTEYFLRIFGAIADEAGNKLDEDDIIEAEYYFTTLGRNIDSTEVADDIEPPYVVSWSALNSHFEVEFSEEIDESTIALSTVYLSYPGYGDGVLSIRNEGGHTIVRFTRGDGNSVSGYTGWVSPEIKDLAGNRKGSSSSHSF